MVIADSTKIKEINTTFFFLNHKFQDDLSQSLNKKELEQIKDADDIATIYCKIGDNIAELVKELLGIKINRKKIYSLNGVASQSISIGTIDNILITIGSGKNTATITDEFSVVLAKKDQYGNAKSLVILGTPWQHQAG
ncbi:hypothetical protein GLOIN_2v1772633 [Rhizophagus clarus]|nr:hypothetical protein GLOIN_2v1772633 [Rhizophagus clarus]